MYLECVFSFDPSGLYANEWFSNIANHVGIRSRELVSGIESNW